MPYLHTGKRKWVKFTLIAYLPYTSVIMNNAYDLSGTYSLSNMETLTVIFNVIDTLVLITNSCPSTVITEHMKMCCTLELGLGLRTSFVDNVVFVEIFKGGFWVAIGYAEAMADKKPFIHNFKRWSW